MIGIAGGFLVALAVDALFNAIGFGIPTSTPSIPLDSIVIGLLVGVGTTVVASIAPARRATKVSPVMALREGAVLPASRFSRWSWIVAVVCAVLGVLLIANGFSSGGSTSDKLLGHGGGRRAGLLRRGDAGQVRGRAARAGDRLAVRPR